MTADTEFDFNFDDLLEICLYDPSAVQRDQARAKLIQYPKQSRINE